MQLKFTPLKDGKPLPTEKRRVRAVAGGQQPRAAGDPGTGAAQPPRGEQAALAGPMHGTGDAVLGFQAVTETLGQICCSCSYKKAGLGKTVWVMMTTCLSFSKYQQRFFFSVLHLKLFHFFSNLVLLFPRVRPSSSLALLH